MASLELHNVSLDFPVYGVAARQMRTGLLRPLAFSRSQDHQKLVVAALQGLTLRADTGDRIALLGSNGAGKSTLLKVLAGIYEPTRGLITRNGRVRTLFDLGAGMEEDASGRQNILIGARYLGASAAKARQMVDEIVDFAELSHFIDLPIRTYSAGMRVRLAFALCTAFEADILLIDEILGVGDAAFIAKATERMNQVITRSGLVVLATHSLGLSDGIAKRGILLSQGRILFDGPYPKAVQAYLGRIQSSAAA